MSLKAIWRALKENAAQIGALSAIVVVVSVVLDNRTLIAQFVGPDVVVRISRSNDNLPVDLKVWIYDAAKIVENERTNTNHIDEIDEVVQNKIRDRYSIYNTSHLDFDVIEIAISNESDEIVSDFRLRIDSVISVWDVSVSGTFINSSEAEEIEGGIIESYAGNSLILSDPPELPPDSSLIIRVTGRVLSSDLQFNAIDRSYGIVNIIALEESIWTSIHNNTFLYLYLGIIFVVVVLFVITSIAWSMMYKSIYRNEKGNIIYGQACIAAKEKDPDIAMLLLRESVKAGFSDNERAKNDDALAALRTRHDFKELFG